MQQAFQYGWVGVAAYAAYALFFAAATTLYATRNREIGAKIRKWVTMRGVLWTVIAFRVLYASVLTFLRYLVWAQGGAVGRSFLDHALGSDVPVRIVQAMPWLFGAKHGYFIFYVLQHFWLDVVIAILGAWVFSRFLRLLRRYRDRFFEDGEIELGYVSALIVGWPLFVAFIPLLFLSVVLVSIFRRIFLKEELTTLGWPFIVACGAAFFGAQFFMTTLKLSMLAL